MSVTRIAYRYAKSLIELAIEKNALEPVYEDVRAFAKATEHSEFSLLLKSPVINSDKKQKVLDAVFGKGFHEISRGFIRIMVRKGREEYLQDVALEFIRQYKKYKKISSVTLTTATPMSENLVKTIKKTLKESPATDENVELTTKVDSELIGGFVLEFDGNLYDASLAQKLDRLRKEFSINEYIKNM